MSLSSVVHIVHQGGGIPTENQATNIGHDGIFSYFMIIFWKSTPHVGNPPDLHKQNKIIRLTVQGV